ncbi:MAG: hypothetical protein GY931_19655 [Maribacter sp.]|nr:hypothetical protein [Maribacter sp.]
MQEPNTGGRQSGNKRQRTDSDNEDNRAERSNLESEIGDIQEKIKSVECELGDLKRRATATEKRVERNESHSRQKNIRFYRIDKEKAMKETNGIRGTFEHILIDGLKIEKGRAKSILNFVDKMHWTTDKALIVGFCKRSDIAQIKAARKNLKDYKIYGQSISMEDDLTREDQEIKKKCITKLKAMKGQPQKYKDPKIFAFNKIVCDGTIKVYDQW